ncbi:MAG TPA: oxidoreductase [Amycolatopsis sp.]|jgi:short-subunit dehydrogenase|nr:oxidoreductase [Amycolatopsis sp.]
MATKVALVTGASSGIGEATARELLARGYTVYGAARRLERMAGLEQLGVRTLSLDITDEESVEKAVAAIVAESGRIDLLVNNAGYGSYGSVEEVPLKEGRYQFEVNIFGLARLTQLVLPVMREQRSGRIVNISSMGGKIYTPLGAWYHATKFALEGFSDALRLELRPFGIDVIVVEPGGIATEWGGIAMDHLAAVSGAGPYRELAGKLANGMTSERHTRLMSQPSVIAKTVAKAATSGRPRTRYAAGFGAKPAIFLRRILPDRAFDTLISRVVAS